jgi:hypothetical protein
MFQLLFLSFFACGGGGLADQAEAAAELACACADRECAKEAVAGFNKVSYQAKDEKDALSEADQARFSAAVDRMSGCRDALK